MDRTTNRESQLRWLPLFSYDHQIRSSAAKALGELGDHRAVEPLNDDSYFVRRLETLEDTDWDVAKGRQGSPSQARPRGG